MSLTTTKSLVEVVINLSTLDSFLTLSSLETTSPGLTVISRRGGMAVRPRADCARIPVGISNDQKTISKQITKANFQREFEYEF